MPGKYFWRNVTIGGLVTLLSMSIVKDSEIGDDSDEIKVYDVLKIEQQPVLEDTAEQESLSELRRISKEIQRKNIDTEEEIYAVLIKYYDEKNIPTRDYIGLRHDYSLPEIISLGDLDENSESLYAKLSAELGPNVANVTLIYAHEAKMDMHSYEIFKDEVGKRLNDKLKGEVSQFEFEGIVANIVHSLNLGYLTNLRKATLVDRMSKHYISKFPVILEKDPAPLPPVRFLYDSTASL